MIFSDSICITNSPVFSLNKEHNNITINNGFQGCHNISHFLTI